MVGSLSLKPGTPQIRTDLDVEQQCGLTRGPDEQGSQAGLDTEALTDMTMALVEALKL